MHEFSAMLARRNVETLERLEAIAEARAVPAEEAPDQVSDGAATRS